MKQYFIITCISLLCFSCSNEKLELLNAAKQGNTAKIKSLLNSGVYINTKDKEGKNALHLSLLNKKYATSTYLINKGILTYMHSIDWGTALDIAIDKKANRIIKLLLKKEKLVDKIPSTIIGSAIRNKKLQKLSLLLKHWGAQKSIRTNTSFLIELAACQTNIAILKKMLVYRNRYAPRAPITASALINAIRAKDSTAASLLLRYGANPNAIEPEGEVMPISGDSVLTIAIYNGLDNLAINLIKRGANINYISSNWRSGSSPLQAAVISSNYSMTRHLLKKGANINAQSAGAYTALLTAASQGNNKMVKLLVNRGANLHIADRVGHTPLVTALVRKDKSMARLLMHAEEQHSLSSGKSIKKPTTKNILSKEWARYIYAVPGGKRSSIDNYIAAVTRGQKLLRRALYQQRRKQYIQAVKTYKKILQQYATPIIYQRLADTLSNIPDLKTAIKSYTISLALKHPTPFIIYYNLACAHSRLKQNKKAFQNLNMAVQSGYKAFRHMAQDKDLKNIRNSKKWALWFTAAQKRKSTKIVINNIISYFKKHYMKREISSRQKNACFVFSPTANTKEFNLGEYTLYPVDTKRHAKENPNNPGGFFRGENGTFQLYKNHIKLHNYFAYMQFSRILTIKPAGPHGLFINGQYYSVGKKISR